jgi:transposase InsO family protein
MMGLSASTYYYRPKVPRALRDQIEAELRDKIEYLQAEYSCFGHRTLKVQLQRHYGLVVNRKRLLRVMRVHNLFRQVKKRFIATTDSNHKYPIYPNLIKALEVTGINQVWVSDITYIRVLTGFVYLAVILDLFSRRVIGWALSKSIRHELTVAALRMAIEARNPGAGVIHHSDRGVQYACDDYVALLDANGFQGSMSAPGNPYDNAFAESFMKTLKNEEVHLCEYESFTDVVERIPQFIEAVYNQKRVHSSIQYLPPAEFEAILQDDKRKASLGQVTLKLAEY